MFKGWKDESGEIVSTEKEYTFEVKGETTLTDVYDDISSGGQIAGIVIGTLLLAVIGGVGTIS